MTAENTAADQRSWRYPGPGPFADTAAARSLFFGRTAETESMTSLFIASRLLLLFGKSGLGKTSLLNAGVFPRLREQGFLPFRVTVKRGVPITRLVADAISNSAQSFATDVSVPEADSLWELFKRVRIWRDGTFLTPVLVFDQFEECFTLLDKAERQAVARDIGHLIGQVVPMEVRRRQSNLPSDQRLTESAPAVKLILSLREDYLAALEDLTADLPGVFQDRFRLLPMSDEQAADAIRAPAQMAAPAFEGARPFSVAPFAYANATVKALLEFLKDNSGQAGPWALQVICKHLERQVVPALRSGPQRRPEPLELTPDDLGGAKEMQRILASLFDEAIGKLPRRQRQLARELCDTGLINDAGRRVSLEVSQIRSEWGVTQETLEALEGGRILRREERLDSTYYEISHDKLAEIIRGTRRFRLPRRVRMAARVFAAMTSVLVVVGVGMLLRVGAEHHHVIVAREAGDNLAISLMSGDLIEQLRRSRQTLLLELFQRDINTYFGNVESQHTGQSNDVIQAFAWLKSGQLEYQHGQVQKAEVVLDAAQKQFERLKQSAPNEPTIAEGFADTLESSADIAEDRGHIEVELSLRAKAIDIRTAMATGSPASDRSTRHLTNSHIQIVDPLMRMGRLQEAEGHMAKAFELLGAHAAATSSDWRYVLVDAHEMRGRLAEHRDDIARAMTEYKQQAEEARRLKESLPLDPEPKRSYAMAYYHLADLRPDEIDQGRPATETVSSAAGHPRKSAAYAIARAAIGTMRRRPEEVQLQAYQDLYKTLKEMNAPERRDYLWTRELWASGMLVASGKKGTGDPGGARTQYEECLKQFEESHEADRESSARLRDLLWAHQELAELLRDNEALRHLQKAREISDRLVSVDPTDLDVQLDRVSVLLALEEGLHPAHPNEAAEVLSEVTSLLRRLHPGEGNWGYIARVVALHERESLRAQTPQGKLAAQQAVVVALAEPSTRDRQNPDILSQYGFALRELGELLVDAKDFQKAAQTFSDADAALKTAIQLGGSPKRRASWLNQRFLLYYDGLAAMADARKDAHAALEYRRGALESVQAARQLDPANRSFQSNEALAQQRIGDALRQPTPAQIGTEQPAGSGDCQANRPEGRYRCAANLLKSMLSEVRVANQDSNEEAAAHWQQLFSVELEGLSELHKSQGNHKAALADAQAALAAITKAVALAPAAAYLTDLGFAHRQIALLLDLGEALPPYTAADEWEKARTAYKRATDLAPTSARAWNGIFLTYIEGLAKAPAPDAQARRKAFEAAIKAEDQATAIAHDNPVFQYNLYIAHLDLGRLLREDQSPDPTAAGRHLTQALAAIRRALELDPDDRDYQTGLALASLELAQFAETRGGQATAKFRQAVTASRHAVTLHGSSAADWNLLAFAQLEAARRLQNSPTKHAATRKLLESARDAAAQATKLDRQNAGYQRQLFEAERLLMQLSPAGTPDFESHRRGAVAAILRGAELVQDTGDAFAIYREALPLIATGGPATEADLIASAKVLLGLERTRTSAESAGVADSPMGEAIHSKLLSTLHRLQEVGHVPDEWKSLVSRDPATPASDQSDHR